MSRIMIIEPHATGHRLQHPRRLIREILNRGHFVQLATFDSSMSNPLFKAMQREFDSNLQVLSIPQDSSWMRWIHSCNRMAQNVGYYFLFRHFYRRLSKDDRPDYIYLATLEYCMNMIALAGSPFGNVPASGLVMNGEFGYQEMGIAAARPRWAWLKKQLFLRMLKNKQIHAVFTIVLPVFEYIRRNYPQYATKLRYVPDPVEVRSKKPHRDARRELGIDANRPVLLVYGAISSRKGIEALLQATLQESFPGNVIILLAGKQDVNIKRVLFGPIADNLREQGRLLEMDRFMSDEEETTVFSAADAVWMGYKNFYRSSGVLYLASAMGIPVIACREGIIGWETVNHSLGITVSVDNPYEVSMAVRKMFEDTQLASASAVNGRRLAESHLAFNFAAPICDTMEKLNIHKDIQEQVPVLA